MKIFKNKGISLIEIIISIALLGLICVSILPIYSGSMDVIFNHGRKSNALLEANSIIDKIYSTIDETYNNSNGYNYTSVGDVEAVINTALDADYKGNYEFTSAYSKITIPNTPGILTHVRMYIGDPVVTGDGASPKYFPVSILVYQSDNKQYVILNAYIPE